MPAGLRSRSSAASNNAYSVKNAVTSELASGEVVGSKISQAINALRDVHSNKSAEESFSFRQWQRKFKLANQYHGDPLVPDGAVDDFNIYAEKIAFTAHKKGKALILEIRGTQKEMIAHQLCEKLPKCMRNISAQSFFRTASAATSRCNSSTTIIMSVPIRQILCQQIKKGLLQTVKELCDAHEDIEHAIDTKNFPRRRTTRPVAGGETSISPSRLKQIIADYLLESAACRGTLEQHYTATDAKDEKAQAGSIR